MSLILNFRVSASIAAIFGSLQLAAQPERGYFRHPAIHGETIIFTAEGDLWKGTIQGGFAQRLTTHPATESHAAISPDGKTLAFSAQYEGATEVYTMPMTGGVPVRRTYGGESALVCGWTREGRVLYATERHSTLPNRQVAEFDLATGTRSLLPLAQASEGVYGEDGRTFFFTRLPFQGSSTKRYRGGTAQNLWRFKAGDEEAVPLTADYPGTSKQPMWWKGRVYFLNDQDGIMNLWSMLPDGTDRQQHTRHSEWDIKTASLSEGRVAYSIGADLRLYEIATGQDAPVRFVLPSDYDQQRDRWVKNPMEYLTAAHISTNGDRVVLTARGQVFVAPVQQGRFVEVTRNPAVRYRNAHFLSGEHLIALSDQSGELEFMKLPANGVGVPEKITDTGKVFRFDGVPSPNGKWIAYYDKDYRLLLWNLAERKETVVATSDMGTIDELVWSPDGEWLAYARPADNMHNQIFLYQPSSGHRIELTSDRTDSYSPAWSPDGKWLYFLSDREIRSLVGHPWGPRQPEPHFDQITRIYQVALKKGQRSPFRPKDELQKEEKPEKEKEKDKDKDKPKEEKKEEKKDESKTGVTVEIDREGLAARLEQLPVPAGNYRNLAATAKNLYWTKRDTSFDSKTQLQQFEIKNDKPKAKTIVEDIRGFELSADGKKMLIAKGEAIYVQDADAGKLDEEKRVRLDGWTFAINPRDEWRQMFVESWRLMRDYFYDRKMHGVDWKAVLDKHLPLVERVTDRAELSDLMSDMVGELSALHIFVRSGDQRGAPDRIQIASLGAELVRDEAVAGWRIRHIYKSDPDYPAELSPLLRPGVELEEGDVLLAINGVSLFSVARPEMLLRNQAGRQALVQYLRGEEKKEVIVTPIDGGRAADLRYSEWEYTRRKRVEELSNDKIGYVHLRAMGSGNIAEWAREFYPVFQRQGLIIDVRHNRGGNIDSWILGKLLRKAWFYWQGRAGKPYWNMQYAFRGHIVVLCNEHTASDGEAFSEGFRRLGLGKVIGTRTWGGEIWLSFSNFLVDKGIASAAEIGVYGPEGSWLIEGHGVEPDMVVDNLPHETFRGKDRQLEAAVEHLQELIEMDPRPVPSSPEFPNKAHQIISTTTQDGDAVAGR